MAHHYALLALVYMIGFVALFDRMHLNGINTRFCKEGLMSQNEANQLLTILSACQE